jgi:hypothetical protein
LKKIAFIGKKIPLREGAWAPQETPPILLLPLRNRARPGGLLDPP